ncbi:hypothetical protein [Subtercola boreus]|nr:hypothetical protein [Subtercola boreus]
MHVASTGRGLAELILDCCCRTTDLPLTPDRITCNQPPAGDHRTGTAGV